jgi:hypothetical protein
MTDLIVDALAGSRTPEQFYLLAGPRQDVALVEIARDHIIRLKNVFSSADGSLPASSARSLRSAFVSFGSATVTTAGASIFAACGFFFGGRL